MHKSELIKALANETELPLAKSDEIVGLFFAILSRALVDGNRIEFRGFGSFLVKEYEGYTGRNPKTGDKIVVDAKMLPFFKVGKDLKEKLNSGGE